MTGCPGVLPEQISHVTYGSLGPQCCTMGVQKSTMGTPTDRMYCEAFAFICSSVGHMLPPINGVVLAQSAFLAWPECRAKAVYCRSSSM